MFKKLIGKLVRKVVKNPVAADVIADKADDVLTGAIDAKTGGAASAAEGVVKRIKADRKAKRER